MGPAEMNERRVKITNACRFISIYMENSTEANKIKAKTRFLNKA